MPAPFPSCSCRRPAPAADAREVRRVVAWAGLARQHAKKLPRRLVAGRQTRRRRPAEAARSRADADVTISVEEEEDRLAGTFFLWRLRRRAFAARASRRRSYNSRGRLVLKEIREPDGFSKSPTRACNRRRSTSRSPNFSRRRPHRKPRNRARGAIACARRRGLPTAYQAGCWCQPSQERGVVGCASCARVKC